MSNKDKMNAINLSRNNPATNQTSDIQINQLVHPYAETVAKALDGRGTRCPQVSVNEPLIGVQWRM